MQCNKIEVKCKINWIVQTILDLPDFPPGNLDWKHVFQGMRILTSD